MIIYDRNNPGVLTERPECRILFTNCKDIRICREMEEIEIEQIDEDVVREMIK